ncbi:MAG: phosphoadenosine phosphosulfate reductase family protein [Dehalococcoidia bacterium]|nr:phosphoadenosine phosphosulfate reductase family protein [Dehalococcoidia bacterium]
MGEIDRLFLRVRVEQSLGIIEDVAAKTDRPLIVQFSGGRDSMVLLELTRTVTSNFVCAYMATGLEFAGFVKYIKDFCAGAGVPLIISNPTMHKGNLFKRVEQFRTWPGLVATWCCRDLKLRPEKKLLQKLYGKGTFYKLEGVRMYESQRRRSLYKDVAETFIREDGEHKKSFDVFPILLWSDYDVINFLQEKGLPTSRLYDDYGVSGCSWCPFYEPAIYKRVLEKLPNHYDRFIEWEEKLGQPSVNGFVYLGDIKREVVDGIPMPVRDEGKPGRSPCQMMLNGELVPTCSVYGHLYIDGTCFRCDILEIKEPL